MTVLDNLLPVLIQFAIEYKTGTVNLCNPGLISHNEILEMYKEIVDPTFTWSNFTIEEQNEILASKRSNNCLNTNILETNNLSNKELNIKHIKEAVRDAIIEMKIKT
jgi:3,5-epimerase/4-reductase